MAYPHLPYDQTRYELVQTRKEELWAYVEKYQLALREAEKTLMYTQTGTDSTVPTAPPTSVTYP